MAVALPYKKEKEEERKSAQREKEAMIASKKGEKEGRKMMKKKRREMREGRKKRRRNHFLEKFRFSLIFFLLLLRSDFWNCHSCAITEPNHSLDSHYLLRK